MLHVDIPTRDDVVSLIRDRGPARVSLYLPTTPLTRDAQADRIALKNQIGEAVGQLAEHDKREVRALEESLLDLVDDDEFWEFQARGLAVFATPAGLRTFRLPNRLTSIVEVSDRFHIKPLLRSITTPQSAFVLALSQNGARLVEVSGDLPAFEVKVHGMPKGAADAVGKASIKDRAPSGRIQGDEGMKVRLAQYARKVDGALRPVLSGHHRPLVVASAEPLRTIYRSVQSYPHLAAESIDLNPDAVSDADLATAARTVLDGLFRADLAAIRTVFDECARDGRTITDVAQAARAVTAGAVHTLLVDIDEVVPGTVDDKGEVAFANAAGASNYGVVDEIASRAILTGAKVLGVRREDIPGGGSLAAVTRYPF